MSVFREAFVELSEVAFAEAKALGEAFEAAIAAAAKQTSDQAPILKELYPAAKLSLAHPDVWIVAFRNYCPGGDWELIDWQRAALDERIHVRVKLKCGHYARFIIDECKLAACARSKSDLFEYLLNKIDEGPTSRCKCGEPQGLGPAGRPL